MKKTNTQSPKRAYQAVFASLAFAFITNFIWGIWNAWNMYMNSIPQQVANQLYFAFAVAIVVLPFVLFAVSWAVIKGDTWLRLYRAILLTLGSILVVWTVKSLVYAFGIIFMDMNMIIWILKFELLPMVVGLIPFAIVALKIQRRGAKKIEQFEKTLFITGALLFLAITIGQLVNSAAYQDSSSTILELSLITFVCVLLFLPVYSFERDRSWFERVFRSLLVSFVVGFLLLSISAIAPMQIDAYQSNAYTFAAVAALFASFMVLIYMYLCRQIHTLPL